MEIKCNVCGTMNDSSSSYCKGCFLPLHKTMQQWTDDIENKINDSLNKVEPIKEENQDVWQEKPFADTSVEKPFILPGIQPLKEQPIIPDVSVEPITQNANLEGSNISSNTQNRLEENIVESISDSSLSENEPILSQPSSSAIEQPVISSVEPVIQSSNVEALSEDFEPSNIPVEENIIEPISDNSLKESEIDLKTSPIIEESIVEPNIPLEPIIENQEVNNIEIPHIEQLSTNDNITNIPIEPIVETEEPIIEDKANNQSIVENNDIENSQVSSIPTFDESVEAKLEPPITLEPIVEQNVDNSVLTGETTILPQIQVSSENISTEPTLENVESSSEQTANSPAIITGNYGQPIEIEVSNEPVQAILEPFTEEELEEDIQEQNDDDALTGETTVLPTLNSTNGVITEVLDMPLEPSYENIEQSMNNIQPLEEVSENTISNQNDDLSDAIPLDKTFINQEALASTAQPYESGPIQGGKDVDDIKNELKDVSIVKDNATSDRGKSAIKLTIQFDLILIALSLIFTFIYGVNINDTTNILFGALSTILFSALAIFITFRKDVPKENEINKTYILIFTTMTLFEIIFRNILFYISDFNALYAYIFITVLYILISIMIVNAISRFVRKNKKEQEPSKFVSKMNIIVLVVIALLVVVGIIARNNSVEMKIEANPVPTVVPDELYTYIESINDAIVANIQNDENYEIPSTITDPKFVDSDIDLEEVNLVIDEYGTVESGEVKYDGVNYRYKEKTFIIQG